MGISVNINYWKLTDGKLERNMTDPISASDLSEGVKNIKRINNSIQIANTSTYKYPAVHFQYKFAYCTNLQGDLCFQNLTHCEGSGLYYAFSGCTGLTSVSFPSLEYVQWYGLGYAFSGCTGITSISFPKLKDLNSSNNRSVFVGTFKNCTSLTTVNFPEFVNKRDNSSSLYAEMFSGCTSLKSVSFPKIESVDGFRNGFLDCTSLESVYFPKIKYLTNYIFKNCTALKTITAENFPSLIGISSNAFEGCTGLTTVELPLVTFVNDYSFKNCTSLTTVELPLVTGIGTNAFNGCINLTTINFPSVTTLPYANYAFANCSNLTTVNFPNLETLGSTKSYNNTGFMYAFQNCTSLKTISFPKLTNLAYSSALEKTFSGCTNLKEVHFHYSLDGNTQCTTSFMDCSGATVYFDIGAKKYIITNIDSEANYYFKGVRLDTSTRSYDYVPIGVETTVLAYKPNYCLYIEKITPTEEMEFELQKTINFATTGVTYSLLIEGVSGVTPSTTFSYNGYDFLTVEGTEVSIIVPEGTEISYKIKARKYNSIVGTLTNSTPSKSLTMEATTVVTYDLSYPFTECPEVLTNLVDGSNFEISETPKSTSSGYQSSIKSSIVNGSKSFNVSSGISYGYIKFHTPDTTDTDLLTVSVTCTAYAESYYDVGAVFIDTAIHQVTTNYRFTRGSGNQDSTYGYVLYSSYGKASSAYDTYTYTLQPNTDYYLQFAYTKDTSGTSYWDRLSITNIKFTDDGTY